MRQQLSALLGVGLLLCTVAAIPFLGGPQAHALTNNEINFQARLMNASGAIVPDGFYNVEFKIYDALTSGTLLFTDTYYDSNGVTAGNDARLRVDNGYLTVGLGGQAGNAFPTTINWNQKLWITMNVGGTTQTATPTYDGEMSPRLQLTAVPYAFRAGELALFNSANNFTSKLSFGAPTGGDQNFVIPDQGAAGTYNVLTTATAATSFVQLQATTPGTTQTGNFNINGTGIAGTLQSAVLSVSSSATTTTLASVTASSINTGFGLDISTGSAVTSGAGLRVSGSGTAAYSAGNGLVQFVNNGAFTGQLTSIGSSGTTTGSLLNLNLSNASQTSASALVVTQSNVTTGFTGSLVSFTGSSTTGSGSVLSVTTANTTAGNGLLLTANGLTTGNGASLTHSTSAITSGALLRVASTAADAFLTGGGLVAVSSNADFTSAAGSGLLSVSSSASSAGTLVNIANSATGQVGSTALNVVQTGTTTGFTGNLVNFTGSSTTGTGNVLNITAVNTTAGNGLNLTANALTTGDGVDLNHSTTALSSGALLRVSSTAVDAFTTGGLAVISSNQNFTSTANTAGLLNVSSTASAGGTLVNIANSFNGQIGSTALNVVQSGTTTGFTGNLVNFTGSSTTGTGNVLNVTAVNTTAGNGFNLTANALTTGDGADLNHSTTAITSGALLRVSSTAVDTFTTGGLAVISSNQNFTTTANTAGLLNVSSTASTGGTLVNIANSAAGQVDSTALNIVQSNTTNTFTGNLVNITGTHNSTSTGNTLNVASAVSSNGNAVNIVANSLSSGGVGLNVNSSSTGTTTGSLLRVTSATTAAVNSNGLVSFRASGDYTSTSNAGLLDVRANNTTAGTVVNVQGTGLTTGVALNVAAGAAGGTAIRVASGLTTLTGATSGDALNVSNSSSTGNVVVFSDNATAVATIADGGAVQFRNETNAATAFQVQSATGADNLFTINTVTRAGGTAGNTVKIGNSTGTDTDTTILVLDGAGAVPTTNLASLSGGLFYNSATGKISIVENGVVKAVCNSSDLGCGTGGSLSLQNAYNGGSTINTSGSSNIAINLFGTDNFTITTDAGATGNSNFLLADGANPTPPSQLVLISNNDTDQIVANGLTIGAAGGGITDGLDVSDTDLVNAINVGDNIVLGSTATIDFTNFDVSSLGVVTLGGGQTRDITTANAGAATALTLQPGVTTNANGTGAATTLRAGDANSTTCGTACTGGTITVQGGSATGASGTTRNGGNVAINGGAGNSLDGVVSIGTATTSAITLGATGITTTNQGSLTVNQTAIIQGANALTLGVASTNTGAILFKGSGGSGTLTLRGPANPTTAVLSIPAISSDANVCTDNAICSGYAAAATSGFYLQQVPTSNVGGAVGANIVSPTAASIVGLTVNATSSVGNAATAAVFAQSQDADAVNINVSNGAGTAGNALAIAKTGAGTLTNGLSFSGTIGTDINRSSGILSLQGTGGVTVTAGGTTTLGLDTAGAGTVTLGNANATTINIGGTSGATTTIAGGNVGHTVAIAAGGTSTVQGVTIGSVGSTSTLTLQAGTGTATGDINIGDQTTAGKIIDIGSVDNAGTSTVRIATAAAVQTITVGSTNSTSTLTLQAGTGTATGDINIGDQTTAAKIIDIGSVDNAGTSTVRIATGAAVQTVTVGSTNTTSITAIQGGTGTATGDINIGDQTTAGKIIDIGSVTNAGTGTVRIATAAAVQSVTIGSTDTTSSTSIQGGTGGSINIGSVASSTLASTVHIADTNNSTGAQAVTIGSNTANTGNITTIQGGSNTSAAVSIQAATAGLIVVGTTNNNTIVLGGATSTVRVGGLATVASTSQVICRDTTNGNLTACDSGGGKPFIQGGNSFGTTATLGTNESQALDIRTNSTTRMSFAAGGGISIPANATAEELEIGDDILNVNDGATRLNIGSTAANSVIRVGESSLLYGSVFWDATTNIFHTTTGFNNVAMQIQSQGGSLTVMGASTFQPAADAADTFQVRNNGGTEFIDLNTSTSVLTLGATSGASALALQSGSGNIVFNNSGTVRATFDASNNLYLGNANSSGVAASPTSFTVRGTGNSTAAGIGGALTVIGGTGNTSGIGGAVTIQGGTGGNTAVGGAVTIQGGNAGGGTANGANVTLAGGTGAGGGVQGLVVINTPTFTTASTQACGSNCNITQANIDGSGGVLINATATGLTVTLSDPTIITAGRIMYVTNVSATNDFILSANAGASTVTLKPNTSATMVWNGSDWTAAGASSSTDLQAAYNNTASSAGAAELVLKNTATSNGLTVRNGTGLDEITGGLLEVQTAIGSNLFTVNNNATEYATNGGAETAGASAATFPASTWDTTTGGTVDRWTTAGDNIATGTASVRVQTTTTNHGARNRISASLTSGLTYSVSFAVRGATNFTTLQVLYSPDGTTTGTTQCATAQTVTSGIWTRITCSFIAAGTITSSNSILIRQTDATARTFYIDNLSVNVNASATFAADGSVDNAGTFATNWTDFDVGTGSTVITRETSIIYDTSASTAGATSANTGQGIRNNMAINPAINTQYLVSFYARASSTMTGSLSVGFLPAGGTSVPSGTAACTDYSTQSLVANTWTKITCLFTTTATAISNPDLVIYQTDSTARNLYVDALSITLNTNNSNNAQVGGGNKGGPTTLFTLDRASTAPIAANNDAYLGSMYYDTTSGRIQCYEADGWGACGAAPDNIVNLNPEYAGAVLNGSGIGTMTADFCANQSGVLQINYSGSTDPCFTSGDVKNYYKWTSPQATQQTYSIYVTYQLPATFNGFSSDDTVQLAGRVTSTTNAAVTYQMYYKTPAGSLTQCGTSETNVITAPGGGAGSDNTWYSYGVNGNEATGCSLNSGAANGFIIFKINLKANNNASAFVSTLSFVTTGR